MPISKLLNGGGTNVNNDICKMYCTYYYESGQFNQID